MQNLGAHELGHVLGLDEDLPDGWDDEEDPAPRTNMMDPRFFLTDNGLGDFTADPFIKPTQEDKMMLRLAYNNVIPIPATLWLFGSGLGLLGFMRRKKLLAA